jgi:hypothetical protein
MNEDAFNLKAVVPWLIATLMALVAWFSRRGISQYDNDLKDGIKRIEFLERNTVTYDHLNRVIDQLRSDRSLMHEENQAHLNRIEDKIDANEERSSKTRHDTKDEVHALALKIAEMSRTNRGSYGS